jgi:thiol:disulfide interchange protein DsbA
MIRRNARLTVLLGLTLLVAACGKHAATDSVTRAPDPVATGAAASTPVAANTHAKGAATGTPENSTITRINEDGSESVEDTSADSASHNPILTAVASTLSSTAAAATTLNGPMQWQEGVNYTRLVPAQPTSVAPGQVEVIEFFWYACPHCNAIDPLVEAWRKTKAPYISFSREHVMWQEPHRQLARMFYTLESINRIDEVHSQIFHEIHNPAGPNPLIDLGGDAAKSEEIQAAFLAKHGVPAATFKGAYHSFAVETAMQRADQLWNRYRITGVPTFVVNGKYITDVGMAKGEEQLLALVSDLAALEHKR